MNPPNKDLFFLVHQFLDGEKFKETLRSLESESGLFFDMKYFENSVINGKFDELEKYLLGFTKLEDNEHSTKIFFEIRKQKYLEALDRDDGKCVALEILSNDLKIFETINNAVYKELSSLLTMKNFRDFDQLSHYTDTKSARVRTLTEVKQLINANPVFQNKLKLPALENSRLLHLINQSLNWQHQHCKYSKPIPDIDTLFVDHACKKPIAVQSSSPHSSVQAPPGNSLGRGMGNSGSICMSSKNNGASTRLPETLLNNHLPEYQRGDSGPVMKRPRHFGLSEEFKNPPISIPSTTYPRRSTSDVLPKTVVAKLNQGSAVKSMDFHPVHPTLLLVGTNIGDLAIWEVDTGERLLLKKFKVWDIRKCKPTLLAKLATEYCASVNKVIWSPSGASIGCAYSKDIVHLYNYHGFEDLRHHLEIDAHVGNVTDIGFASPSHNLCIVTCGEDETIKVWNAADGTKRYVFEGHEAPISSISLHAKDRTQFIFSTGIDGNIMAWLYDGRGPCMSHRAPGHSCTAVAYSADERLFTCGTTKESESFIIEWNETDGSVIRKYRGLGKSPVGVAHLDTSKWFLAVGDEFAIKVWDMDSAEVLETIDAGGGLPASPSIRFNKEGSLLAVSTADGGIKVLANAEGSRLIWSTAKVPVIGTHGASSSAVKTEVENSDRTTPVIATTSSLGDGRVLIEPKPEIHNELDKSMIWKLTELEAPSNLRCLRLPDNMLAVGICKLVYTNSGRSILALAGNAVHKLWNWPNTDMNDQVKATTDILPQLWQPANGMLMTNDISDINLKEAVHCFALSKNDSYVVSASGGKVSLFNVLTSRTMTRFMAPPPAVTCLAFHLEDNNVIAIGRDDSSIQIYNIHTDEIQSKLEGHQKRVTGLAFSSDLKILVSSGADAQLCVWKVDGWEKQTSKFLPLPYGRKLSPLAQTRVQFHKNQAELLVVHETQLAIYEAPKLDYLKQWISHGSRITDATYSCSGKSIYASFEDGSVRVFVAATLSQRCRICRTAYLPQSPSLWIHPVVVAAHPMEANQFSLGLSDGGVVVLAPLEGEGRWGTEPPQIIGAGASVICGPKPEPGQ